MRFKQWYITEATQEHVEKVVDPALLTQQEYYNLANPSGKHHPDDAYQTSLYKDNEWTDRSAKENHPEKIRTVKINGIDFEFRLRKQSKTEGNYVKTTPEGEVLRDENDNPVYLTDKEKEDKFKDKKYTYSIGVYTKEDGWVGGSQDEWGALLIRVVDEYRGFGLGPMIGKLARQYEPDKDSGGFTNSGYKMFRKVHSEYVRDYLKTGMYSHLVNSGQITAERAKAIIASIDPRPNKSSRTQNLDTNNPSDWLLYVDGDNFIIYDKKLKDIIDHNEDYDFWRYKMIKGTIFARASGEYYRILYFGGENDQIKTQLMTLCAINSKTQNAQIVIEPEDEKYVDPSKIEIIERNSFKPGYNSHIGIYRGPMVNLQSLGAQERQFRKSFDQYDQFQTMVAELAYAKYKE